MVKGSTLLEFYLVYNGGLYNSNEGLSLLKDYNKLI